MVIILNTITHALLVYHNSIICGMNECLVTMFVALIVFSCCSVDPPAILHLLLVCWWVFSFCNTCNSFKSLAS